MNTVSVASDSRIERSSASSVRFFFASRRRHTRCLSDWSSDVCSSDLSFHYTPLNAHYKALLKKAEKNKKNLIMIDAEKDEWRNEKPTGKRIREIGRASCRERV